MEDGHWLSRKPAHALGNVRVDAVVKTLIYSWASRRFGFENGRSSIQSGGSLGVERRYGMLN